MAERALLLLLVGIAVLFAASALGSTISDSLHRSADRIECATQGTDVFVLDDAAES